MEQSKPIKTHEIIDKIIHEVNVAESIDCSEQTRHHITKQCFILHNDSIFKFNELKIWILNNQEATVPEIQSIIFKLQDGGRVRDITLKVLREGVS